MGRARHKIIARTNQPDNQYAYEEGHKSGFWNTGETLADHAFDKHQRQAFERGLADGQTDRHNAPIGYKITVACCLAALTIGILLTVCGVAVSIYNGQGTPLFFAGIPMAAVAYLLRGVSRLRVERATRTKRTTATQLNGAHHAHD